MLHLKNFTPDLQKFTQINLSYLWYFTTLHHAKMSSEYDPDDAHYDDPGYDAYWHGYSHGHRDGYDKGTCSIIIIIIIIITRLFVLLLLLLLLGYSYYYYYCYYY